MDKKESISPGKTACLVLPVQWKAHQECMNWAKATFHPNDLVYVKDTMMIKMVDGIDNIDEVKKIVTENYKEILKCLESNTIVVEDKLVYEKDGYYLNVAPNKELDTLLEKVIKNGKIMKPFRVLLCRVKKEYNDVKVPCLELIRGQSLAMIYDTGNV